MDVRQKAEEDVAENRGEEEEVSYLRLGDEKHDRDAEEDEVEEGEDVLADDLPVGLRDLLGRLVRQPLLLTGDHLGFA